VRHLLDEWRMYVRLVEEEPPASEPARVEILTAATTVRIGSN
jgi:hypothetical protein